MAKLQTRLVEPPIDKRQAQKIALRIIRSELGSIPQPGEPVLEDDAWVMPIIASVP